MVTQCAVLEQFGIFLVLAGKSLFAHRIEDVIPASADGDVAPRRQKLYNNVQFFRVGSLSGRTLVIVMQPKKRDSIFRVAEPVMDKINRKAPERAHRLSLWQPKSRWFKEYKAFYLPCVSFDIIFLNARIAIPCAKGFEVMDMDTFKSVTIPRLVDDLRLARLPKPWDSCRPMSMIPASKEEILLCYNEFGLYVDKHGIPSKTATNPVIEWEGSAERVALHAPYILLFHPQTIEVREIATGRLGQIIPGNGMHCIWDHRHPESVTCRDLIGDGAQVVDLRVYGVMNVLQNPPRPGHSAVQRIFTLVPTGAMSLPQLSQRRSTPFNEVESTATSHSLLELQTGIS
ncbi:CNH domain-containing protein [Mycena latifolia]|nr:CNH domain-containing protein [Mycena latifolia]